MRRSVAFAALLVAISATLPGCAVALFSSSEPLPDAMLMRLEDRMSNIEAHLPK